MTKTLLAITALVAVAGAGFAADAPAPKADDKKACCPAKTEAEKAACCPVKDAAACTAAATKDCKPGEKCPAPKADEKK